MRPVLPVALLVLLGACNQGASPPAPPAAVAGSGVTPAEFRMPGGAGCAGEVQRTRAVMDNDLATGHLGRSVHQRVTAEIDGAAATCAAGREQEALRAIEATKARYGYR